MNVMDIFSKKQVIPDICLFSSTEKQVVNYSAKEDRSESITFTGIGRTKYGSGIPPTIYDAPITAVRSYPIVYGCVTAISEAIAALGVKVYSVKGGQRVEVTDHPFYQVFTKPNPYQGSFEFMEALEQSLDVNGNAFISKERVAGSYELYLLNPKYMAIVPDTKIKVKEYRYYINGQSVAYKPEEIIHIKFGDPDDPYYGLPPLATASDVLNFEKYRLLFANQFFLNGAIPVGVLETEQVLGETLLKKLRGEWTNIHGGVRNSHKVGILQGGLKYRPITSPIKELDFPGLKRISKEDILTIFKIPESILGSQEGTGAKEGKDAITAFWRQCIIPRLKRIESGMNRGLAKELFGEGAYVFEFNLKDVAALQDDKTELADYLQKMVASSIMTPNEARAVIGLPKIVNDGEVYADKLLVSNSFFGNQLMPVEDAAAMGAGSTQEKPAAAPGKPATGSEKPAASDAAKPKETAAKPTENKPAKSKSDELEANLVQAEIDVAVRKSSGLRPTRSYVHRKYGYGATDLEPDYSGRSQVDAVVAKMSELLLEVKQVMAEVSDLREEVADYQITFLKEARNIGVDAGSVMSTAFNSVVETAKAQSDSVQKLAEGMNNTINVTTPAVDVSVVATQKPVMKKVVKVLKNADGTYAGAEVTEVPEDTEGAD